MVSTGKRLWIDLCFLAILVFQIPNVETSHGVQPAQDVQSRRSLNRNSLLSLLDSSRDLKLLDRPEPQQRHKNREESRYDLSVERYHRKDRDDRLYKTRLDNDRQHKSGHHHSDSLYDKLSPYVSHKNLLALKHLLGDDREEKSRHEKHRNNRHDENLHTYENRNDQKLHTYENRQDDNLQSYESRQDEQHLDQRYRSQKRRERQQSQALRYKNDDRDRRQDDRDRRSDDRGRRTDDRGRRDYDRDRRQDDRSRRPNDRYQRQDNRYQSRNELDSYNNRYVDEYNKRYSNSNNRQSYNPSRYRERSSYRSGDQYQYRKPHTVNRDTRYNNLRARLEKLNLIDKREERYESRLRQLRARLTENLLNLDQSPVKSLLRAADDLDCAAQLQCINQCIKKVKQSPKKKDECSNTCEEEIQCNDDEEDLCNESGHDSCGDQSGTGSTKGPLVELENNECC